MKNPLFFNGFTHFKQVRNGINLTKALALFLFVFVSNLGQAQISNGRFLSYDFSALVSGTTYNTYRSYFANTTFIDSAGTTISRGSGLTSSTATNGAWAFTGTNNGSSEASAVTGNDYVEFQVKPKAGNEIRLDSVIIRWQFSAASIAVIHSIRTSTNGYATSLGSTTTTSSATAGANNITRINLTTPLIEKDTFSVRIYLSAPSGGGTGGRIYRFTDGTTNNSFNHDISLWGRTRVTPTLMQAFDFSTSLGSETTRPTYTCDNTY